MDLVIVESPTKAKTIAKFLGKDFTVESSYGHIRDLPRSQLGIDVENNFEPHYVSPLKCRPTLKILREAAKKSQTVILATDEDREGEAIAWHLAEALKIPPHEAKRVVFHEITKEAIADAFTHPRGLDQNLINAQQARRVLDRLVGYKLSPFLWKKVAKGLSAGRVQSVAVRLIVERENEIRAFKPQEYWSIAAVLKATAGEIEAELVGVDGRTLEKLNIKNEAEAQLLAKNLEASKFAIAKIDRHEVRKNPPAPFTTSTLQQEAAKRLGYSSKKTMLMAQRLYEVGLITYMRTDSTNLSEQSLKAAKNYLLETFGERYAAEAPKIYKTKTQLAQEAHEAVRPTNVAQSPDEAPIEGVGEKKLYKLIWQRFLASQMPVAIFDNTIIEIKAAAEAATTKNGGNKIFDLRASGSMLLFDGFLKVWPQKYQEKELPKISEQDAVALLSVNPTQHFTEPPARYGEASLIKTLEKNGIGRPSTYAPTISVIQLRNYVKKEGGRFFPTEIGEMVNKVLTENFNDIFDIGFTAKMESNLDEIAEGHQEWRTVIGDFYHPFAKKLEEKYGEVKKEAITETTDEVCDKCGKPMVVKFGRFGKFIACSGFPECKNTKQLAKEAPKLIGLKCPDCKEGDVVERRVSRGRARGKIFWGCSKYPACKYASWENPLGPTANNAMPEKENAAASPKEDAGE